MKFQPGFCPNLYGSGTRSLGPLLIEWQSTKLEGKASNRPRLFGHDFRLEVSCISQHKPMMQSFSTKHPLPDPSKGAGHDILTFTERKAVCVRVQ